MRLVKNPSIATPSGSGKLSVDELVIAANTAGCRKTRRHS